ncbi:MAG TPA: hypothetical protein P5530_01555 [Candidatus Diapherotrites archaeon]|nr:hypothetical protein [Candidatus Diapherotrites archaeon]
MSFALKYQEFLDKINNRVPIKWLTKPIDKIHPLASFFLFIIIVIVVLLLIFKPFGLLGERTQTIFFTIGLADDDGEILRNFEFQLKDNDKDVTQNYRTGNNGQFSLELDKYGSYSVVVDKAGYKYFEEDIDLSKTRQNFTILIFNLPNKQSKTLTFVGANGQKISENLNVTITCQDGTTIEPTSSTVTNGTANFDVPVSCTNMVATAIGINYSGSGIPINQTTGVVNVPPKAAVTGTGRATIRVKSGTNYLDGITLRIYAMEDGINPVVSGQTTMGGKSFANIEIGEYKVIATDDSLRYESAESTFTITKDTETQLNVEMSAINGGGNPGDTETNIETRDITVIVKDSDTGVDFNSSALAQVFLITDINGSLQTVDTKSYEGTSVSFRIDKSKNYSLTVRATGYLAATRDITPNANSYFFNLEKETISNVSDINVTVLDEENLPVIGATLIIYNGDNEFQDTRYDSLVTDEFGKVNFESIAQGKYFIKLRKANVVSSSQKFTHTPPTDTNMSMTINVGTGTIRFNIKNINEETISFANIKLYSQIGEEIGTDQATQNGEYSKTIKADKILYAKISKEGYYDYYTELIPIISGETITKDIKLIRVGTVSTLTADFVGLFNEQNQKVEYLAQNSKFYFKFRLINPTEGTVGFRFLAGDKETAEEDIIYIRTMYDTKANVSYYSNTNLTIVTPDIRAKVIDAKFVNASVGVYELLVPVGTVQANRGQAAPIYYSVFTSTPPILDNLNSQKVYYIDTEEICSETFCLSGQYVDVSEDIVYDLEAVNNLVVNKTYNLKYVLTNAKSNVYNNNRLLIANVENTTEMLANAIDILSYNITGGRFEDQGSADNQLRNKIPFTSDYLNSLQINVYDKIEINTTIKPAVLGTSRLQNKIISNQSVVYNEFMTFNVSQQYPFTINYEPKNIVPNKPFDLTVVAIDESGLPVSGALVNIYQRRANNQQIKITSGTIRTNDYGKAIIPMPVLRTGERIIINLEKSGYFAEPVEFTVEENIVSLKQDNTKITDKAPFTININKTNPDGTERVLTIINNTDYPLQLKQFKDDSFNFRYSNYLNIPKLQQYLNSQVANIVIPANGEENLRIKIATSQDAEELTQTLNITGNIIGYVSVDNSQAEYPFNIPISLKVSVGEGVEEDDCLVIQGANNPWKQVVSSNDSVSFSFDIQNNCVVKGTEGQSLPLDTIRAKIVNSKDMFGSYNLTVDGKTITLSEGSYTTILKNLSPGGHHAVLTYYSQEKKFGDVETKIYINGQVKTNDGLKYVNTTRDVAFTTNIAIRKIQDCIEFYDGSKKINDMFVITKETNTYDVKELTVKNNCADLGRFKLNFCEDIETNPNAFEGCGNIKYDNLEGFNDNELRFKFGDSSLVAGIKKPEVPGGYLVPVKIAILNSNDKAITTIYKNLKINVHSSKGLYMEDPFIEVDKNSSGAYNSATVKLLNHDINTTPWDYAMKYDEATKDTGFSKYINTDAKNSDNTLKNLAFDGTTFGRIKFKKEELSNLNNPDDITGWGGFGISLIALPLLLLPGPWALFALLPIAMGFIAPTLENQHDWQTLYFTPTYTDYFEPDKESSKNIIISDTEIYINIFDITGYRYMINILGQSSTDLEGYNFNKKDLLINDVDLSTIIPNCDGTLNRESYKIEPKIIYANENCDNSFKKYDVTSNTITAVVGCDGSWPRKEIDLHVKIYLLCKYNESYWPEQSGIKPLSFTISDVNDVNKLSLGDNLYKTITFYPTLDDQIEGQDPAFKGAKEIGKFRFAFISKQYPERLPISIDLEDCITDSGRSGKTGKDALPNVSFNWDWKDEKDIDKCSDGNYCDATQLSQVIVSRLINADNLITKNKNNMSCPRSNAQVIDQATAGTYNLTSSIPQWSGEVPANYTGIDQVRFGTDGNLTKIQVSVQNRTTAQQTGSIRIRFGEYVPKYYSNYDSVGNLVDTTITSATPEQNIQIMIPTGEDDSIDYTFTYGTEDQPIIGNNIPLTVIYSGTNAYSGEPSYTYYQTDINASIYQASVGTGCQVPATTAQFNGVDYIDMWFDANVYPNNVVNSWDKETINKLKNYLEFDAYLITDNYNQQFLNDFDKAHGGKASGSNVIAESWFSAPGAYQNGIYSPLFRDHTSFSQKYTADSQNGVNIIVPGKYRVRIDLIYNNENWRLTKDNGEIDAKVVVTFTYIRGPENDSVFYRMPFDGFVGMQNSNSYSRQNYGLGYIGDVITITRLDNKELKTEYLGSSNPKKYLNVQHNKDFFKINSNVETRGNLFTIKEKTDNQIEMIYSPSVANPVIMKVKKTNLYPFSAYYQLKNDKTGEIMFGGNSLGIWTGVSKENPRNLDFSGDYVFFKFNNFYDRQSEPDERMSNSYAIDWEDIARTGTVYLRTIFYTPYGSDNNPIKYNLISKTRGNQENVLFMNNDNDQGTSTITLGNSSNTIYSLEELFRKVENKEVCVVNSDNGKTTEFYWNPKTIYETNGNMFIGEGLVEGIAN